MDPSERRPPILVCTRIPVLRGATVIYGYDDSATLGDKASAEGVVDGAAGRGVCETSPVEEDNYRYRTGDAERLFELSKSVLGLHLGGGTVNTVEEGGGAVNNVEGVDTVDREDVGTDFAVEELVKVAVEGAVGAA